MKLKILNIIVLALIGTPAFAAGPTVHIVVGAKAEPLEKFAADEMSGQLKKLFDADVKIVDAAPADAANVIYLGTNESSPYAANVPLQNGARARRLESVNTNGRTELVITGANARAVLDGAYEFGRHFGIRSFRFGDLYPTTPPSFTLVGFDHKDNWKDVKWDGLRASPFGLNGLTSPEIRDLLRQLSKLGLNEVQWNTHDVTEGRLFREIKFPVDGDTAGRAAFKGAKLFENPDFYSASFIDKAVADAAAVGIRLIPNNLPDAPSRSTVLPHRRDIFELFEAHLSAIDMWGPNYWFPLFEDIFTPVCGDGVGTRIMAAYFECEKANKLIEANDAKLGIPDEKMLVFAAMSSDPPPAWWGEVRTHYLNAMNEMYRANTRAREGGRAFTLYYARRFEFGFEYMNAVEALRKAAIAKKAGNKDEEIAELEKALDSITGACNAMAAVARSNSDRGIIAVMNEYGYRPVTKLLEEADSN